MNTVSMRAGNVSGRGPLAIPVLAVLLAVASSAWAGDPVANIQTGYAGAAAGDWANPGRAVGPADDLCAAMGSTNDKVNLLSGFDLDVPGGATINGLIAYVKSGSNGGQNVGIQLASQAATDPPNLLGNPATLATYNAPNGNCSSTEVTQVGSSANLSAWGSPSLSPAAISDPAFGVVLTKLVNSNVKIDAVCLEVFYTTTEGTPVDEVDCFAPPPEVNQITVIKELSGADPGSDWEFEGDLGSFTLPSGGGFSTYTKLNNGTYTITETTKPGYDVSVECLDDDDNEVATGTNSVEVTVEDDLAVTCIFTNREIVPAGPVTRTTFTVQKLFSDGNPDTDVTIHLQCFTGLPLNQQQTVSTDNDAEFEVQFVVESFEQGELDCNVYEGEVPGYTGSYEAESNVADPYGADEDGCYFKNIDTSNFREGEFQNGCFITNDPDPVEVTVNKDWVIDGSGGDQLNPAYELVLWCGTEIVGGKQCKKALPLSSDKYPGENHGCYSSAGDWFKTLYHGDQNGTSDESYTAHVIPDWDGGTNCYVDERVYDDSVEVDASDCEDWGDIHVVIGAEDGDTECTVTNTVFYEGIPTLSQYGMVIMALLMLGVGLVGFRRFA